MSASQRRKGADGEREAAKLLAKLYPHAERRPMQARGAVKDGCEIEGTPYWVEVKSGAAPPIMGALRQARRDIEAHGDERPPLVLAKTTRQGWTVTMEWADFAALIKGATTARDMLVTLAREATAGSFEYHGDGVRTAVTVNTTEAAE